MKLKHSMLGASIALALATSPLLVQADTTSTVLAGPNTLAGLNTTEAPRVTQVVNSNNFAPIPNTHLTFKVSSSSSIPDTATMNHLQLILKPSEQRQLALQQLIAGQHNPQSSKFHQWITPAQYGENFGVTDADIATVTAWLTAQGFTVNTVYPNKTEIDFSGTAGQVRAAFHTQENLYTFQPPASGSSSSGTPPITHLSNNSDISVPTALQPIVAGVMGLNDFHVQASAAKPQVMQWNAATKTYQSQSADVVQRQQITQQLAQAGKLGGKSQAVGVPGAPGARILMPYDLNQMYDANTLRAAGITGKGVTIAVVENGDMAQAAWTNFVSTFNLARFGGTFAQVNPAPASGATNCLDPDAVYGYQEDDNTTDGDAEWTAAMAPGANIMVAACSDVDANYNPTSSNFFGGVFIAATNEINLATGRPNIISANYANSEYATDSASKQAIDAMWAQADAEGISVFVTSGQSGPNPNFYSSFYTQDPINGENGNPTLDANALATSPNDTGVGGTDLADVLDGTTSKYFASTPLGPYGGSALGYVPEIPWNETCGNGVAATAAGYSGGLEFCQAFLKFDPNGIYAYSHAGGGGRSSVDTKPSWQADVYNAAPDGKRDLPDVALYSGSYNKVTSSVFCTEFYPCALNAQGQLTGSVQAEDGFATPMFAGIQALVDQALGSSGAPANQGNAAPTLYALAQQEYGTSTTPNNAGLTSCASNDNGNLANNGCVFHNIVRGNISTNCLQPTSGAWTTDNCYFYGTVENGQVELGLTSMEPAATTYTATNKAYTTRPGWSLASGLGSVDATNLVAAWKKFAAAAFQP